MAMLAEPRRKHKYSINPRGSDWSNNENKFGQKLMEKMGWSRGKGLGANEDGRLDNVGIKLKNDTKGVGCTNKFADKWIEHQDDFNDLLLSLNQEMNNSDASEEANKHKVTSLERKSEKSKSRVHYMKFTKGKDLSSRSQEDMDCIFGMRKTKKKKEEEVVEELVDEDTMTLDEANDNEDKHGIKTFTNTCSIQEYFALKMKQRSQALLEASDSSNQSTPSSDGIIGQSEIALDKHHSDEQTKKYSTKKTKRVSFNLEYHCYQEETSANKCHKSKIKNDNSRIFQETEFDEDSENAELVKKKFKKRKKSKEEFNEMSQNIEDIEDSTIVKIKKKKKKKSKVKLEEHVEITEIVKTRKKKSKKKHKNSSDEINDSVIPQVSIDLELEEDGLVTKKKSKKKRKNSSDEIDDSVIPQVSIDLELEGGLVTKKKSKKTQKYMSNEIKDNYVVPQDMELVTESPVTKEKSKKKKYKRDVHDIPIEIENEYWEPEIGFLETEQIVAERKSTKKKKKRKYKEAENEIFDVQESELTYSNLTDGVEVNGEILCDETYKANNTDDKTDDEANSLHDKTDDKVPGLEYCSIEMIKNKNSVSGEQVKSICDSFKNSNIHEIVGYLNTGPVARECR